MRPALLGIAAIVVVACAFVAAVLSVRSTARRVLGRWVEIGLPAPAPQAQPADLVWSWPPRLQWRDVVWSRPGRFRLSCDVLEVELRPIEWMLGRGGVARVEARSLEVESEERWVPWFLRAVPTGTMPEPPRPPVIRGTRMVEITIDSLRVGDRRGPALRVRGWGSSGRTGHWSALLHARQPQAETGGVELRMEGAGSSGIEELSVDALFAHGRNVAATLRHPAGSPPIVRLSGRDDGGFLSLLIPRGEAGAAPWLNGSADFDIEWSTGSAPKGELRLQDLGRAAAGSDWRLRGSLCLADGIVSSQDVVLESPEEALRLQVEQPARFDSSGTWSAEGRWGGHEIDARARIVLAPGEARGVVHSLERSRPLPAPIDFVLDLDGGGAGILEAVTRFDGGTLQLRWDAGQPLRVMAEHVPLAALRPWIPDRVPGRWSGRLDAESWIDPRGDGTRVWGTTEMTGEVKGIALLEEIATLWEGRERATGVPIDRLRAQWSLSDGEFLAESLWIAIPSLRGSGSIHRSGADSLLGLLRVRPGSGSRWGSIFLLLGGNEERMDLGIGGTVDDPTVTPVGETRRRSLERRLTDLATRLHAVRDPSGTVAPSP